MTATRWDLHIHTTMSDGKLTPKEIVQKAMKENVSAISITDHDSIAGLDAASAEAKKLGLKLIPGIEISAREIDVLGYYINYKCPELITFLREAMKISRKRINWKIRVLRKEGYSISFKALDKTIGARKYSNGALVNFLKKRGYSEFKKKETGLKILRQLFSLHNKTKLLEEPHPRDAICAIRQANGVAVWAHPMKEIKDKEIIQILLKRLKKFGMQGIEIYHSSHNKDQQRFLLKLAKKNSILITGGSDFHGTDFRNSVKKLGLQADLIKLKS